jgi:alpha-1,3-rhamnosyl/mannosyltransferase
MPPDDPKIDPATGRPWSWTQRVRRSLARRFPRTAAAFHRTLAKGRHFAGRCWVRVTGTGRLARWLVFVAGIVRRRRGERRLTVAVDITAFWEPLTGIGWYLYRLLEELAGRDDLRLRLYGPTGVDSSDRPLPVVAVPSGAALEEVLLSVPTDLVVPAGPLIRLLRRLEPLAIAADSNRILFAPNFFLPRRFALARGRLVATIHDLGSHRVPETLQPETLVELEAKLERSLRRASVLISVSGAVRDELVAGRLAPATLVRVVHHGPGQLARVRPTIVPAGVPRRYALHVGTLEPRKNVLVLLEAWRQVRQRLPEAPALVLCGRYGWRSEEIRGEVERAAAEGWLLHLGYVGEGELAALYRGAAVVVFPSRYEGFGLPAIEAQHAHAPLVASDLPVLREVAGDGALYAAADRPDEFAAQVLRVLTDEPLRRELVLKGERSAARLSWERTAAETARIWLEVGGFALLERPKKGSG